MKLTNEQLPTFIDGVIYALDECMEIHEDKDLKWEIGHVDGKTTTMIVVTFNWVDYWTVEDEEPHFADEMLYLDGTETPAKIVRDIRDILERINEAEIEYKSRKELIADAYFD